jgi:hypothetical protein
LRIAELKKNIHIVLLSFIFNQRDSEMYSSSIGKINLQPSLIISGIVLPISGVLSILLLTSSLVPSFFIPSFVGLLNVIFYYLALASITLPLIQIGIALENKKNTVISAIILLLMFAVGEIVIYSTVDFYMIGAWGYMGILTGIFSVKLAAFILINKSLNLPERKYGTPLLVIYGSLFLIDTIIGIFFVLAGMFVPDPDVVDMIFTIISWLGIVFSYMEQACFVGVGIKFISDGIKYPVVDRVAVSKVQTRTAPAVQHDDFFSLDRPVPTTTYDNSEDDEEILTYCSYCGAQTFKGNRFCENCGQKIE